MIHEVMVLDYSGPDLAFILYASGLKMVLIATLMADMLDPRRRRPLGRRPSLRGRAGPDRRRRRARSSR